jgi:hypothetical protein
MEAILRDSSVRQSFHGLNKCRVTNCKLASPTFHKLIERTTRLKCTQKRRPVREACRTKYFIKNQLKAYLTEMPQCMKSNCIGDIKKFGGDYLSAANRYLADLQSVLKSPEVGKKPARADLSALYEKYKGKEKFLIRKIENTKTMIKLFSKGM